MDALGKGRVLAEHEQDDEQHVHLHSGHSRQGRRGTGELEQVKIGKGELMEGRWPDMSRMMSSMYICTAGTAGTAGIRAQQAGRDR